MTHQTVGNRVREVRSGKGMTQAELAEQVGVARVSILSIEKGHYIPTIETAMRIAQSLDVPLADLFWLKDGGSS